MSWNQLKEKETTKTAISWQNYVGDNILIYGDSKIGKTFVASQKIKQVLENDSEAIAYVFNTDMGFRDPAIQVGLGKFGNERIKYFPLQTIEKAINTLNDIMAIIKPNDVILFDLVSWIWEESQKAFISELSGGKPVGFIKRAMTDSKKFGFFEGMQWGYVKKLDDMITSNLAKNPKCKVIAVTASKDVTMDYALNKKKKDIWSDIGKPAGRKDMMFEFANIIKIEKDDNGKRKFMLVGTRKGDLKYEWTDYTTAEDFWNKVDNIITVKVDEKKEVKKVENDAKNTQ